MALSVVQRIRANSSGSAASVTTAAASITAGNLVVAFVTAFANNIGGAPVTDSVGSDTWSTGLASTGNTQGWMACMYAKNTAGGGAVTFTFTPSASDFINILVYEIAGADTASPLSNTNSQATATTTHNSGTITAGGSFEEIFLGAIGRSLTTNQQGTMPLAQSLPWTGYTSLAATASIEGISSAYQIVAPSTTDSFQVTDLNSTNETIMILGFKGTSSGGGTSGGSYTFC